MCSHLQSRGCCRGPFRLKGMGLPGLQCHECECSIWFGVFLSDFLNSLFLIFRHSDVLLKCVMGSRVCGTEIYDRKDEVT